MTERSLEDFDKFARAVTSDFKGLDDDLERMRAAPRSLQTLEAEALELKIAQTLDTFVREYLPRLTPEQLVRVRDSLPAELMVSPDGSDYGSTFSLANEIGMQITTVRALRDHVFPFGKIKEGINVREAQGVLSTCNTMIKTLMGHHEKIMSLERMRAIELATVDAMVEMGGEDLRKRFLELLAIKLEAVV